ncbi:hypothetical protein QTP88_024467 [Uroleucon formosanum]
MKTRLRSNNKFGTSSRRGIRIPMGSSGEVPIGATYLISKDHRGICTTLYLGPTPVSRFGHRYFCGLRQSADDGRPLGLFGRTSKVVTVGGGGATATKVFETDDGDSRQTAVDIPSRDKRHLSARITDHRIERSERRVDDDTTVALLLLLLFIIINSTWCARRYSDSLMTLILIFDLIHLVISKYCRFRTPGRKIICRKFNGRGRAAFHSTFRDCLIILIHMKYEYMIIYIAIQNTLHTDALRFVTCTYIIIFTKRVKYEIICDGRINVEKTQIQKPVANMFMYRFTHYKYTEKTYFIMFFILNCVIKLVLNYMYYTNMYIIPIIISDGKNPDSLKFENPDQRTKFKKIHQTWLLTKFISYSISCFSKILMLKSGEASCCFAWVL